jgi:hypothetical protein
MRLPNRLFFTGVPGSRWSGISQVLETMEGVNISDWSETRFYNHAGFSGHRGSYFGPGMEFTHEIEQFKQEYRDYYLDSPWESGGGMKILRSHEWSYKLQFIKENFLNDWIMLVYRPDMASYTWWLQAGGFNITYPSYKSYENPERMHTTICEQNKAMLEFGYDVGAKWSYFDSDWIKDTFGQSINVPNPNKDILVTVIK